MEMFCSSIANIHIHTLLVDIIFIKIKINNYKQAKGIGINEYIRIIGLGLQSSIMLSVLWLVIRA